MKAGKVIDRDHGWRDMLRRVDVLRGASYAKVGILAASDRGGLHKTDPDTGKASPLTVAEIAVVNEFGTADGRIPSRSFVRSTFDEQRTELGAMAQKLIAGVILDGKMTAEKALNLMGLRLATEIKKKVTAGSEVPPPGAPSTVARKERKGRWNKKGKAQAAGQGARTLVDTGRMVGAISWAVVEREKEGEAHYVGGGGQ